MLMTIYWLLIGRVETGSGQPGQVWSETSGSDLVYIKSGSNPGSALNHMQ